MSFVRSDQKAPHVIVIGAGFGGLSAAAHLHARGAKVTILERADTVGGKAARQVEQGFVFDTGPTLLTMPEVVRQAFAAVSAAASMPTIEPVDPQCRYLFADGAELLVRRDRAATAEGIARFSEADARAWSPFLDACAEIWKLAGEPYLEAPFDGFASFSTRVLRRGPKAVQLGMNLGTLDELARAHFRSPNMIRLVGRFATYAGGTPTDSSAAFAMIAHLETTLGAYYPKGGMHALAAALAAALERAGVVVRTRADVASIEVIKGITTGVVLTNGDRLAADAVVCNADVLTAFKSLLPAGIAAAEGAAELEAKPRSLSGVVFSFGVEGELPHEAHHTVLFADDYQEEFRAIFERNTVPADPTIYVSVPTFCDPARAPAGHHTLFAMINAPADERALDAAALADLRDHVVSRLEARFAPGLGARIRVQTCRSARELVQTGAFGGAIYGAAPHGKFAPFERPRNRASSVEGLYFVGGTTHPGGGVPMVTLGGKFVADLLMRDRRERRGILGRLSHALSDRGGGT